MNTIMNPSGSINFLNSWTTISFSKTVLLRWNELAFIHYVMQYSFRAALMPSFMKCINECIMGRWYVTAYLCACLSFETSKIISIEFSVWRFTLKLLGEFNFDSNWSCITLLHQAQINLYIFFSKTAYRINRDSTKVCNVYLRLF
jgi:hypothetical protein